MLTSQHRHGAIRYGWYQPTVPAVRVRHARSGKAADTRRIARADLDLADDLAQEAFWKLSEFDLDRIKTNEKACIL
jgi:hypothetical protein